MTRGKRSTALMALSLSILLGIFTSTLIAQTATPTPEEPSAFAPAARVQSKPMPMSLKIIIAITAFAVVATALAFSIRAWRSSNLFDREYRFPPVANVALRLGANKSGGCMAAIAFGDGEGPASTGLTPENF